MHVRESCLKEKMLRVIDWIGRIFFKPNLKEKYGHILMGVPSDTEGTIKSVLCFHFQSKSRLLPPLISKLTLF